MSFLNQIHIKHAQCDVVHETLISGGKYIFRKNVSTLCKHVLSWLNPNFFHSLLFLTASARSSQPPLFMIFVYLAIDGAEVAKFVTNQPPGGGIFGTKAPPGSKFEN